MSNHHVRKKDVNNLTLSSSNPLPTSTIPKGFFYSLYLGNALDYLDTALIGLLSHIMAPLFFPVHDPFVQLLYFGLSNGIMIISKPLGTYCFTRIVIQKGPAKAFCQSLMGMGITTAGLGLIPSYDSIGILAPIILIFLRAMQGFFGAAEHVIISLYPMSLLSKKKHLSASMAINASMMVGIWGASLMSTAVIYTHQTYPNGWRLVFFMASVSAFLGLFMRWRYRSLFFSHHQHLSQPNLFKQWIDMLKNPIKRRKIMGVSALIAFDTLTYHLAFSTFHLITPLITNTTFLNNIMYNNFLVVLEFIIFFCVLRLLKENSMYRLFWMIMVGYIALVPLSFSFIHYFSLPCFFIMRMMLVMMGCLYAIIYRVIVYSHCHRHHHYSLYGLCYILGGEILGKQGANLYLWDLKSHHFPYWLSFYIVVVGGSCLYSASSLLKSPPPHDQPNQ
jgi:MFS family permease